MEEIWKIIPDYPNYQISNFGNVSTIRDEPVSIYGGDHKHLYYYINIKNSNGYRKIRIHTIVAQVFIGDRPPGYEINHIDLNKLNNRVSNLEYVTRLENMRHYLCSVYGPNYKPKYRKRKRRFIKSLHIVPPKPRIPDVINWDILEIQALNSNIPLRLIIQSIRKQYTI